jgi:hypothetical protein
MKTRSENSRECMKFKWLLWCHLVPDMFNQMLMPHTATRRCRWCLYPKNLPDDPRVHRFYRNIGCIFKNKSFYGNIQIDGWVYNVTVGVGRKGIDISGLTNWSSCRASLAARKKRTSVNINIPEKEKMLEKILKERVAGIRWNDGGKLNTSWDDQLSYLLYTALSNYE